MFDAPIYICVQNMAFRIVIGIILCLLSGEAECQRMGNESTNVDRARMGFLACWGMPSTNGGTHIRLLVKKIR
jgi:hypothetical protein